MAIDDGLAERIRRLMADEGGVSERRMFGGLAFLISGHLAIAASGEGGALVRVDPAATDELLAATRAEPAVMRGRPLAGWLRVATVDLADDELARWVARSVAYARSLPAKT